MTMEIYGIAGGNRSGKSTFAEYLKQTSETYEHLEFSDVVRDVANDWLETLPDIRSEASESELIEIANTWLYDLPSILEDKLSVESTAEEFLIDPDDSEQYKTMHSKLIDYLKRFTDDKPKEYIDRENKYEHVEILQWLGHSTREIIDEDIWTEAVRKRIKATEREDIELLTIGGVRYESDAKFVRSLGGFVVKILRNEADSLHDYATESAYKTWEADLTVHNDGSLAQLRRAAEITRIRPVELTNSKILDAREL